MQFIIIIIGIKKKQGNFKLIIIMHIQSEELLKTTSLPMFEEGGSIEVGIYVYIKLYVGAELS